MKARCEIDLSPGGRTRPLSGPLRSALSGWAAAVGEADIRLTKPRVAGRLTGLGLGS